MPRHADPALEQRILKAALRLWKQGGQHALTMRAVAKAARTTTPTVYERFRSREEIIQALCVETRQKLFLSLKESTSPRNGCEIYLDFAAAHPHEYELLSAGWSKPPSVNQQWPTFSEATQRMAQRRGGAPEDYKRFALALWALLHGTAMLIVVGKTGKQLRSDLRQGCLEAIDALSALPKPVARD